MTDVQALERARESLARRAWADSYRHFKEADREVPLGLTGAGARSFGSDTSPERAKGSRNGQVGVDGDDRAPC